MRLRPWESRRLQPSEIMVLQQGDQDNWNRVCELAAWMLLVMGIVTKEGWKVNRYPNLRAFMRDFNPPGYIPKKASDGDEA